MSRARRGRIALRLVAGAILPFLIHAPAFAGAGRLGGGEALQVSLGRIVVSLLISVAVIVLAVLLIRQRSGRIDLAAALGKVRLRPRAIDVVETRRLSPHADVCVIRHQGAEYLLLLGAGHAQLLSRSATPAPVAGEDLPCA